MGDRLESNGSTPEIRTGEKITSANGNFSLVMQDDGNVVLYNLANKAIWSTKTDGKGDPPHRLRLQDDGDLAIYDGADKRLWHTKTEAHTKDGPFKLVLQDDRNLVIYNDHGKAIWSAGTHSH